MAMIKCKMCGGELNIEENSNVAVCEYCGTKQTVPTVDNEKKIKLFDRANRLRMNGEFDKAATVYESIIDEFDQEAEGYWGNLLCKYGIEYVDDPATGDKVPTCHRSSFDSIMDDPDFEMVMENADPMSRSVYREQAKAIEEIRKGIIEVSGKEAPYDIFICYKETAEDGQRTLDSVLAQDVYDALTDKGYRVFFSRISLEDKLGTEYEPYIFAALNSAKIMLAFGTSYDYYNAVWVKNEWSRYLKLMAKDKTKHLIPCFKDIDAYDMPKEFARLQAQDLGKVGAVQDLLRGIEKILGKSSDDRGSLEGNMSTSGIDPLVERGMMFVEDGDWKRAYDYFERALDANPKDGKAYLGKVLVKYRAKNLAEVERWVINLDGDKDFERAMQFGSNDDQDALTSLEASIRLKYQRARLITCLDTVNAKKRDIENERKRKEAEAKKKEARKIELASKRAAIAPYQKMLAAGAWHTVGLRSDGTVVVGGKGEDGRYNVSDWEDIVAVAAGWYHTVGLRSDGTVIAVGENEDGQCNVSDWEDIVAIAAGRYHTVGLKSDGTVVAVGETSFHPCDVSDWENIVAVAAGFGYTEGLRSDGTVVAVGGDYYDRREDVEGWKLLYTEEELAVIKKQKEEAKKKREEAEEKREETERKRKEEVYKNAYQLAQTNTPQALESAAKLYYGIADWRDAGEQAKLCRQAAERLERQERKYAGQQSMWRVEGRCQYCGGAFKGLFMQKCSQCHRKKDY